MPLKDDLACLFSAANDNVNRSDHSVGNKDKCDDLNFTLTDDFGTFAAKTIFSSGERANRR